MLCQSYAIESQGRATYIIESLFTMFRSLCTPLCKLLLFITARHENVIFPVVPENDSPKESNVRNTNSLLLLVSEFVDNITNYRSENLLKFPTDEDLNGAAVALMRLQDTYKLDTSSVARGELNGVQYSTQLSAGDCFELGRQSYQNKDYYHTVLWMTEAMDRYHEEVNKTTTKGDILEYLAFSTYMQGNIRRALQMTNELLEIYPNHERARGNKIYYEDALQESKKRKRRGDDGEDIVVEKVPDGNYYKGRGMYEKLCRNEVNLSVAVRSKLFCRYVDFGKPFLKLAKLKEEEAYLDPRIVLYHDVISDREIKTIQQMATPRFKRATVQNSETGKLEIAHYRYQKYIYLFYFIIFVCTRWVDYVALVMVLWFCLNRISKSAWLEDHEHPHIAAVSQRVEDITGLNMATSESLQVVNYGIGGHYEPHFDFARVCFNHFEVQFSALCNYHYLFIYYTTFSRQREEKHAFQSLGTGNRIATILFYVS